MTNDFRSPEPLSEEGRKELTFLSRGDVGIASATGSYQGKTVAQLRAEESQMTPTTIETKPASPYETPFPCEEFANGVISYPSVKAHRIHDNEVWHEGDEAGFKRGFEAGRLEGFEAREKEWAVKTQQYGIQAYLQGRLAERLERELEAYRDGQGENPRPMRLEE